MALLMPALEAVLDRLAPPHRVLRLPRLELSVRLDTDGHFPPDLWETISDQVAAQIREDAAGNGPDGTARVGRTGAMNRRQDEADGNALGLFLLTGNLPWAANHTANQRDVVSGLRTAALADPAHAVALCADSGQGAPPWFRLLHLLQVEEWPAVAGAVTARSGVTEESRILRALLSDGHRHLNRPLLLKLAAVLAHAATGGRYRAAADFALSAQEQHQVAGFAKTLPPSLGRIVTERMESGPESGASAAAVNDTGVPDAERAADVVPARSGEGHERLPAVSGNGLPEGSAQHSDPVKPSVPRHRDILPLDEELFPILVRDAGLVILAPFLPRFLAAVGVTDRAGVNLPAASLPRAAALLAYLARGDDEPQEFAMGLIKVLLGLQPTAPVPVCGGLLNDQDREEAEALLTAVIGHWSALKHTTPAGLRATFLRREGLLREEEDGWRLTVERTGFDILLEQVPWGMSIVKLPWMAGPLVVEW